MRYIIYKHGFSTGFEMIEPQTLDDALRYMVSMLPVSPPGPIYSSITKNRIELGYEDGYIHLIVEK